MQEDQLTQHIGNTLRRLRKERDWTLDQLASATGVSKPMLGQIERGESNPTIVTLWKIAKGLQLPFSAFLQSIEHPQVTVLRQEDQPIVLDDERQYVVRNLLAVRNPQPVELFLAHLHSGCSHSAEAHGVNVTEGLWVMRGQLTLTVGDDAYVLGEGDSVYFRADVPHSYTNACDTTCEFLILMTYLRSDEPQLP
jgi:transcriptional regulator with XRE-family HTH domain